jgi:hypothetical protein
MTISLEEAQQRFEHWRQHKSHSREPIPEELWDLAVSLIPHYTQQKIADTLRLSTSNLSKHKRRRHGEPISKKSVSKKPSVSFIKASPPSPSNPKQSRFHESCERIEIERSDGYRMKLTLRPGNPLSIEDMIQCFLAG